jgi:transcriptional regulator with XRE-family HTH domain
MRRTAIGWTTVIDPLEIQRAIDELGDRVRRARRAAGLSLAEFGKRCGLSASAIQKIENRSMAPSIPVIMKIAAGLGMHVGDLLAPPKQLDLELVVQRAREHTEVWADDEIVCHRLSAALPGSKLEAWRITLAPGVRRQMGAPQRTFEQVALCVRGCVELELGSEVYVLQIGDTLHCKDKLLFSCANPGPEEAEYIIAGHYPHGLQLAI